MDKDSAKRLVKKTLQSSFNKEQFVNLIKNLLNEFNEKKRFTSPLKGQYISKAFQDSIKTLDRIGQYKDSEGNILDILIVHLKKDSALDRARSKQRNYIAKYLKDDREGQLKDGALVAFVSPNKEDWRFSFVQMEYKFDDKKKKIKEEWTPARRYSFLVGENENSHTAQSCLLPLLQDDKTKPTIKDLGNAFSVETVTKEFYEKYRLLFMKLTKELETLLEKDQKIREDFKHKKVNPSDFSKKLLGQIVFLYFLQKKGWFGVKKGGEWGTGSKKFLRELFEKKHGDYNNFFNDILEPLFYEALSSEHTEDYYSRFNCRIPFLNGGLFEPIKSYDWINTDILLPDCLFSNQEKTKEGDIGNGILDIFDRYNFTVKEDEPLEKEVAVDPEMLGKVFENLLEIKDRKSKGAYYTPREIVHYMCQESLINYLFSVIPAKAGIQKQDIEILVRHGESAIESEKQTASQDKETKTYSYKISEQIRNQAKLIDEKLKNIRICDPAVGSGAFPVGMMNEIVKARNVLTSYLNNKKERTAYHFKRQAIEQSLYGVDIDSGAIEIAKLRLWLSLVVDEEEREKIQPLPNLDYKMVCGNSLLESNYYKPEDQIETQPKREKIINKLKETKNKFTNETSHKLKIKLLKEIKKMKKNLYEHDIQIAKKEMIEQKSQTKLFIDKHSKQKDEKIITGYNLTIQKLRNMKFTNFFDWHIDFCEVFYEKKGFDLVIANPPYVKEYVNRLAFDGLRKSAYYQGKMDLWYFFACKSIDISRSDSGIITFIAQNNWITSHGASKMRNKVIKDSQILNLIDFGDFKIFKKKGIQTMIMVFKKNSKLERYKFDDRKLNGKNLEFKDVIAVLKKEKNINAEYINPEIDRNDLKNKKLTFSDSEVENFINKLSSKANFQLTDIEVANGIHHHHDYIRKKHINSLDSQYKIGDGVFVINDKEKNKLPLRTKELSLIKPHYTTKELFRWYGNSKNKDWVIYTDSSFKNTDKMKEYPNIKKHLDQFKKIITSDNKPYGLHRARKESFFKGEKIIAVRKCSAPTFTYVDFDSYVSATFYVIKTNRINQKYLTGILNSKLIAFWLKHKGKMQGSNYQIDKEPLLSIPIVRASENEQQSIIEFVDKILSITKTQDYLKNSSKQKQVAEYEKQIDHLVYKLYNLAPEEIKTIKKQ